jgi:hypothetical protein
MRRYLGTLTTRGRSFVAAGITAAVCAFILGEEDLLRVGVLIAVLPFLSLLMVSRSRYRLRCVRRVTPSRLPVGHSAQVGVTLHNVSRLRSGFMLVEDEVPFTLGTRPRFVIDHIEPRGSRDISYRVSSDTRGRYRLGPLKLRLSDPFGLVELDRSFTAADRLTVTPAIVPLPHGRLVGSWSGGGESLARTVATAGEDDVAPREYRHGDDLRRVHWRSTARYGELMVRREEQQWQSSGTIFFDTRRSTHRGQAFEQAVSVVASIGVYLAREGFAMRFITDTGATLTGPDALGEAGAWGADSGALLDMLAVINPSRAHSLATGLAVVRMRQGEGLLIAVFGELSAHDAADVVRLRRGTATCVAVLVARAGGTRPTADGGEAGPSAADVLRSAGWRVVMVESAVALATAWTHADQAAEDAGLRAVMDRTAPGSSAGKETTAP